MSLATLARYRKRQAQGETEPSKSWIAVEVSSATPALAAAVVGSGLAVALAGGRRIEVGCGFDADTLIQLLSVLEGR